MLIIKYINISKINLSQLEKYINFVSLKRQIKVYEMIFDKDKIRTIVGELMLKVILKFDLKKDISKLDFKFNEHGKPLLEGIDFNVSHSGDFVICAVSEKKVGVDIEEIKEIDLNIANNLFCKAEALDIKRFKKNEKIARFYDYWVLKESYLKYLGSGLSVCLDSFCLRITNKNHVYFNSDGVNTPPSFKFLKISDKYRSAICCNNLENLKLREVSFQEIKKALIE